MNSTLERLAALLPDLAPALTTHDAEIREVRLRANQRPWVVTGNGNLTEGRPVDPKRLAGVAAALMDFSVYAREEELRNGFFTLHDGSRVGVCGEVVAGKGGIEAMKAVGSLCVRLARAVPGCADGLMPLVISKGAVQSAIVLSPPGLGKTTLLRDVARQLSERGLSVCVADERHELAACHQGVPTLDLGPCCDVLDGGPKPEAIRLLLRSMAPQVIVTDEIGGPGDAAALAEARRCGVAVIASAHADGLASALKRRELGALMRDGVFDIAVALGGRPGVIQSVYARSDDGEGGGWSCV